MPGPTDPRRSPTERERAGSARQQLEEELLQTQKMEAVGRLAGGVAHDFNNLLTIILGNCTEAREALPPGHPQRRNIAEIEEAADRAATLTRQLLAFSGRQILRPEALDLNGVVAQMTGMLQRVIGHDVTLVVRLSPEPLRVMVDPGQMQQVLLNLCLNARDAMPSGGTVTIETSRLHVEPRERLRDLRMQPGPHACLIVRDTGVGIADDVKRHVFEPFFTTKEVGKGTGLGLATAHGIVRQSKGGIFFETTPGGGTTFTIALPVVSEPGRMERRPGAPDHRAVEGGGWVLIVEDEPAVRALACRALAASGLNVLVADSGDEALAIAASHDGTIDLLFTDVQMPGMSGPELARRIRAVRPGISVLYTSGYSESLALAGLKAGENASFLQKPFTLAEIRARIAALLEP